ncbi:MAG: hypothetical protein K0B11_03835 [Mariniphaga sp.]|nr:hypothetical protein [Mariniphaga sp.]
MAENIFSDYRKEGKIKLSGFTKPFRRVGHSTSNYFKASSKKDLTLGAVSGASNAWSTADIGLAIAGFTGFAAAGSAAIALPATSVAVGLVGIAMLAKSTYSNRDAAHEKLRPFVWSLIDDVRPERSIYTDREAQEQASNAAIYLLKEADSQYQIMAGKYENARQNIVKFFDNFYNEIKPLLAGSGIWQGDAIEQFYERTIPSQRITFEPKIIEAHIAFNNIKVHSEIMWKTATSQGGPVFEYMRRLVHLGNYLQVANILSVSTFAKLSNSSQPDPGDILLKYCQDITQGNRNYLQAWSSIIKEKDDNYQKWERFIMKYGIDRKK